MACKRSSVRLRYPPRKAPFWSFFLILHYLAFYVYIIYSDTLNKRYFGQTADLHKRLFKHNNGQNTSTKLGIPWRLLATLICDTRSEAMRLEKKIKNLKSLKRQDDFMIKHGFTMQEVIGPEK